MTGYKNAPAIEPQIGDLVLCGLPGETATAASVIDESGGPRPLIVNCSIDGALHLNLPSEAVLVRTVDGREPGEKLREGQGPGRSHWAALAASK